MDCPRELLPIGGLMGLSQLPIFWGIAEAVARSLRRVLAAAGMTLSQFAAFLYWKLELPRAEGKCSEVLLYQCVADTDRGAGRA